MMTMRARALGMSRTTFRNASGLPDWNQVTTAADMAVLARHLITDFPGFYHYFSTPYFIYGGRFVHNHQSLLTSYYGADGLKTGYTDASGFNVVTSAVRGDTRLIGVVLGAASSGERNGHMASLLDQGFDRMGVPLPSFAAIRHEPALRLPALISVAQAQSLVLPSRVAARPRFARVAARREHPAYYPAAEPRHPPQVRATMAPIRTVRPTRTAHGGWYRYPG
jgi:D-alanyl-D-alanine carboxypeptidase